MFTNGWKIEKVDRIKHIIPVGELHSSDDCPCMPEIDEDLVIHNSFDKREEYERGRKMS